MYGWEMKQGKPFLEDGILSFLKILPERYVGKAFLAFYFKLENSHKQAHVIQQLKVESNKSTLTTIA